MPKAPPLNILLLTIGVVLYCSIMQLFRAPYSDETLYLHDLIIIAECFQNGQWIGSESVGLHGWLFKIPSALLVLFFGSHIGLTSIPHILMAAACCLLLWKTLREAGLPEPWTSAIPWMLVFNAQFILSSPTFLREIPLLFSTLLLLYFIRSDRHPLWTALAFFLLLEAKEYMFFAWAPAYALGILLLRLNQHDQKIKAITSAATHCAYIFAPSIAYLVLMFTTEAVPVNMFSAKLLGLIQGGFSAEMHNYSRPLANYSVEFEPHFIIQALHLEKILHPRTFSYMALPIAILLPSFVGSIFWFRNTRFTKESLYSIFFWFFLFIFLVRASHSRYLLPAIPLALLFTTTYIREQRKSLSIWVTVTSLLLVLGAISYPIPFKGINLTFSLTLIAIIALAPLFKKSSPIIFTIALCVFTSATGMAANLLLPGNLGRTLKWGKHLEANTILEHAQEEQTIGIIEPFNTFGTYAFYRRQTRDTQEWKYNLHPAVARKAPPTSQQQTKTYALNSSRPNQLLDFISQNNLDCILLVQATGPDEQDDEVDEKLSILKKEFSFQKIPMQGKTLYVVDCTDPKVIP